LILAQTGTFLSINALHRRGDNYIEVDVDVGSSRTAANVVGTVQGSLKSLVIDLAVLLEGHSTVGTCCSSMPQPFRSVRPVPVAI